MLDRRRALLLIGGFLAAPRRVAAARGGREEPRLLLVVVGGGARRRDVFGDADHETALSPLLAEGAYLQAVRSETGDRFEALRELLTGREEAPGRGARAAPRHPPHVQLAARAGLPAERLAWITSGTGPEIAATAPLPEGPEVPVLLPDRVLGPELRDLALELDLKAPDPEAVERMLPLLRTLDPEGPKLPLSIARAFAGWLARTAPLRVPAAPPPGHGDARALDLAAAVWKEARPRLLGVGLFEAARAETDVEAHHRALDHLLPRVARLAREVLEAGDHVAIVGDRGRDTTATEGRLLATSDALSVRRVGAFFAGPAFARNDRPRVGVALTDLMPTVLEALGASTRELELDGRREKAVFR